MATGFYQSYFAIVFNHGRNARVNFTVLHFVFSPFQVLAWILCLAVSNFAKLCENLHITFHIPALYTKRRVANPLYKNLSYTSKQNYENIFGWIFKIKLQVRFATMSCLIHQESCLVWKPIQVLQVWEPVLVQWIWRAVQQGMVPA